MVSSKVRLVPRLAETGEGAYRMLNIWLWADYYTSYPLFKDASGVAIAAIGTLSSAVQFGEVSLCLLKRHAAQIPDAKCRQSCSRSSSGAIQISSTPVYGLPWP